MALIKCPECGKEISDKSSNCIHCGYPLQAAMPQVEQSPQSTDTPIQETTGDDTIKESPELIISPAKNGVSKRKYMIIGIIAVLILIAGIYLLVINHFSSSEKYALNLVEKYQDMLKDPDSMVLRSDVVVISSFPEDGEYTRYCFFTASGNNSYGAAVTSTACFVDGKYICDMGDFPSDEELLEMNPDEALEYLGIKLALSQWRLHGESCKDEFDDVLDSYAVDGNKIARKLHIDSKID